MVKQDLIRGMSNLPLSPKGMDETIKVAKRLADRGGIMGVSTSTLTRALQTGTEILKRVPYARIIDVTSALEPWHLGSFEGEPSITVHQQLEGYVKNPDAKVPGFGSMSKIAGESLNDFMNRYIPYLKKQVRCNPKGYGLILCCHYRNIKAAKAWAENGGKDNNSVDPEEFLAIENAPPDSLWCVEYENGKWIVEPEDLFGENEPLDDVYLLRHGATDWNHDSNGPKQILAAGS